MDLLGQTSSLPAGFHPAKRPEAGIVGSGFTALRRNRCALLLLFCLAPAALPATFGTRVVLPGGAADLALDEVRGRIYLTQSLLGQVQIYSIQQQTFLTPIQTDQTPLSVALSGDGKFLYVTCYDGSALDVIDLSALTVVNKIALPAKPEGVAVGKDGRVLITTSGNGTNGASNVLLLYDPAPNAAVMLSSIPVTPSAATPPTLPPPAGRAFLASHSQLRATRDGSLIVGINVVNATTVAAFVYEAASDTVLRSRIVPGSSTVLSISDDGTRFLCGPDLFDTASLQVLARANLANAPYPIDPSTNFNLNSSAGGGVFSPDGQTLYSAYDVTPSQTPSATASVGQLMLTDPDNLLIRMGLQMPENLAGKMVISADGNTIYALSDSGFTVLPVGSISQGPLAMPASTVVLLTKDQCGVFAQSSSAAVAINNPGRGRVTATAQLLTTNQATPTSAPTARPSASGNGAQVTFTFNPAAARTLGTLAPPADFQIQSPEAINIPNRVRVYQNNRDSDARGMVVPIPVGGLSGEAFPDLVFDQGRQRIYIANEGLNRLEVYDIGQQAFLAPIKVGQMPVSMALTPDGSTLYVANSGGESISIVDPNKMQAIGSIAFPPIPFNSNTALATPSAIAFGLNGPMLIMNSGTANGTLWSVVGNTAVPRGVSRLLGSNTVPVASTMAGTPGGEYILVATNAGAAYLYDATADDFIAQRQVFANPAGYLGPVAAGPKGQYFVMNGTVLNQALTPSPTVGPARLVSAVAAAGNNSYAIFSPPAAAAGAAGGGVPTLLVQDATTGAPSLQVNALEGPITQATATGRATISGRTMAIDAVGAKAYVVTISGLSIVSLAPIAGADRPAPSPNGTVNLASYQLPVAANGLISIFGQNLGSAAAAPATPLPLVLGGTCVTLNNVALPLYYVGPNQINAQIPPGTAAGSYPLVVRNIAKQAASVAQQLAVSKYAPAVVTDGNGQIALFHADGKYVSKDNPASRDEPLTLYAIGLGPTTGGTVTAGAPSPSNPLAVTGPVEVFFGDPSWKQAGIIVDWSGLAPGWVGLYQLNLRVPGFHINGDALPVMLRVGSVDSPTTGPVVPQVAVQ